MKKLLLAGNVPFFAVILLCAAAFCVGQNIQIGKPNSKVAVVEKGAIFLQAALERQNESAQQINEEVKDPIINVLKKYESDGYVVIDVSKDERGDMAVLALPENTIDISKEVRAAIKKPQAK